MNVNDNVSPVQKVVILGAGFAGLAALKKIVKSLTKSDRVEITLIDRNNYFVFAPLLHQVALGVLHPWDIITPLRLLKLGAQTRFVQALVEKIDLKERGVATSAGRFDYDYLLIALGSTTNDPNLAHLDDHPNVFNLKILEDASDIKNQVFSLFEKATIEPDPVVRREMLTFCIAGAGFTGTELSSAFSDMVFKYATRIYKSIDPHEIRIHLIEMKDRIIDDLPPVYSAHIARHLQENHIDIHYGSQVTAVDDHWVELNGTEKIPCRTLIRVTGVVASRVAAAVDTEHDERGRIVADDYLGVPGYEGVYVVGDCVHYRDAASGIIAQTRAHHAVRQAKAAGINIAAELRGTPRRKYHYSDSALIISLGRSNALFRFYNIWIKGFPALLVWVAAYSLLVTGVKNRFKIAFDWILSRFYGPDLAVTLPFRLSTRRRKRGKD